MCENCLPLLTALKDENHGLQETIRRQAGALGKARREDPDKKLREHESWDRAHRLFKVWQRATGHTRSKWTIQRFKQCLPFLEAYEDEIIVRAISGLAFDPMTRPMKNGLGEERFDGWETLFKSDGSIERHANRAPVDWKATTLEEYAEEEARAKGRLT